MNIGIVGTRKRDGYVDFIEVTEAFDKIYKHGDMIISGGCPKGGDRFAEIIAKRNQIPITIYYAQWNHFGKTAGYVRNSDIARASDVLIACVAKDRKGGTENTIKKFKGYHPEGKVILV